jgi:hypothetical protein
MVGGRSKAHGRDEKRLIYILDGKSEEFGHLEFIGM